jgi:hypothetical protein
MRNYVPSSRVDEGKSSSSQSPIIPYMKKEIDEHHYHPPCRRRERYILHAKDLLPSDILLYSILQDPGKPHERDRNFVISII